MNQTSMLREFVVIPFPDESQGRELLAGIMGRELNELEFARGVFSFQIAQYFLAWLAISRSAVSASKETLMICTMNFVLITLTSGTGRRLSSLTSLCLPASGSSRPLILQRSGQPSASIDITALTTTKLTLFDLVGTNRLREYYEAMAKPSSFEFYFVAERVLFHYGAKQFPSVPIVVVANILLEKYRILTEMISAISEGRSTGGREEAGAVPFSPSLPDITTKQPLKTYSDGKHTLFLVDDVAAFGGSDFVRYKYVLAAFDGTHNLPVCFITLESSALASDVLCVFESNGSHLNYGTLISTNLMQEFLSKSINLLRERFALGDLSEMNATPQKRPWWKLFTR